MGQMVGVRLTLVQGAWPFNRVKKCTKLLMPGIPTAVTLCGSVGGGRRLSFTYIMALLFVSLVSPFLPLQMFSSLSLSLSLSLSHFHTVLPNHLLGRAGPQCVLMVLVVCLFSYVVKFRKRE